MDDTQANTELPLATSEHEQIARTIFEGWEAMSPAEWAARFSHTVGCSSFDTFRYRDQALQSWIYQLHAILLTPGSVKEYRTKFLSVDEIREIDHFEF